MRTPSPDGTGTTTTTGGAKPGRRRRARGRRRRGRLLWPAVLGLAVVGAAAAVLAGGRRQERDDTDDDADDRPGVAGAAPPAAAGREGARPRHGAARRVAGAQGSQDQGFDQPQPAADLDGAAGAPVDLEQAWIAGPAGTLFVRAGGPGGLGGAGAASAGGVAGAVGAVGEVGSLPVLFIHSLAGNGGQWSLQLDHLRRSRRALALDLRGHGESDPASGAPDALPGGPYAPAALAGDVAAVADHFALRRFVLVGHSLGATVAMAYAAAHAPRVAGLLLVDPNGDQTRIPRQQIEPFLEALRADPLRELEAYFRQLAMGGDRDAARWVMDDLRLTHEEAIAAAVEGGVHFSPIPALAAYRGPKLAVISEMNSLPYSLHTLVPDLPVHLMRGTGHWLMMDRPELFNRVLDEFLQRVENA